MKIEAELARMERMTTGELSRRYVEVCGEAVRTRNRSYLIRKIAWRLQAADEGDLSERARARAAELANDADVRLTPPREATSTGLDRSATRPGRSPAMGVESPTATTAPPRDSRLPAVGTALVKRYKGRTLQVIVRADGIEYDGQMYSSLSAVAKVISGSHINGFRFFNLGGGQ